MCSTQSGYGCPLLRDVVCEDLQLERVRADCWTNDVSHAIACLPSNGAPLTFNLSNVVGNLHLRVQYHHVILCDEQIYRLDSVLRGTVELFEHTYYE